MSFTVLNFNFAIMFMKVTEKQESTLKAKLFVPPLVSRLVMAYRSNVHDMVQSLIAV